MTDDDDVAARDKREMHVMWGVSAAIVLLILGAMGANMIWGHHPPGHGAERYQQSVAHRAVKLVRPNEAQSPAWP